MKPGGKVLSIVLVTFAVAGAAVALTRGVTAKTPKGGDLEAAKAAALAYTHGGQATEVEVSKGKGYEVDVTLDNGQKVEVRLDADLKVIGQKAANKDEDGDDEKEGGKGHHDKDGEDDDD